MSVFVSKGQITLSVNKIHVYFQDTTHKTTTSLPQGPEPVMAITEVNMDMAMDMTMKW